MADILVIKLGALGDFVVAFEAFQAIRAHHADDRITLLTTAPYAALAEGCPWFDDIWVDTKPRWSNPGGWLGLRRRLRGGGFARVYDLQTSDRSGTYFRLFWPGPYPEWSGIARGCSQPDLNPDRAGTHALDLRRRQLEQAGIAGFAPPDMGWLAADVGDLAPAGEFALLVPGSAPHRPEKRWPAASFARLAGFLSSVGMTPLVLGTEAEADAATEIMMEAPRAESLIGRTSLRQIAALARRAEVAVGNDTGPMHLIAASGCRSIVLFSGASDPAHSAPTGERVTVLHAPDLADLAVEAVEEAAVF